MPIPPSDVGKSSRRSSGRKHQPKYSLMRLEIVRCVVTLVTEDLTGRKTYSCLLTVNMHIELLELMGTIQATVWLCQNIGES